MVLVVLAQQLGGHVEAVPLLHVLAQEVLGAELPLAQLAVGVGVFGGGGSFGGVVGDGGGGGG